MNPLLRILFFVSLFLLSASLSMAQPPACNAATSNCFDVIASPSSGLANSELNNVTLTFDNISQYYSGITQTGKVFLRVKAVDRGGVTPCKWRLNMIVDNDGAPTANNKWEKLFPAAAVSNPVDIATLQVKVSNSCLTPAVDTWQTFNLSQDVIPIIQTFALALPNNPLTPCISNTQVNGAGDSVTNFDQMTFNVEYRVVPNFTYSSGVYFLKIWFCLEEYN